ncbi:hypothetical protein B0H10DRAFT_1792322, partial [Mycena sp. CBHHK59/15]
WALIGERAHLLDFFVQGVSYSVLPAISLNGVLHLDIIARSWTAVEFRNYLDVLLDIMNPFPHDNSVLVMNNASVHHFDGIREMGFSALKYWIRRNCDMVLFEMDGGDDRDPTGLYHTGVLWNAVYEIMTPQHVEGWFRDSGYVA